MAEVSLPPDVPRTQLLASDDDGLYEVINNEIIRLSRGPVDDDFDDRGDAIIGIVFGFAISAIIAASLFFGGWVFGQWYNGLL